MKTPREVARRERSARLLLRRRIIAARRRNFRRAGWSNLTGRPTRNKRRPLHGRRRNDTFERRQLCRNSGISTEREKLVRRNTFALREGDENILRMLQHERERGGAIGALEILLRAFKQWL